MIDRSSSRRIRRWIFALLYVIFTGLLLASALGPIEVRATLRVADFKHELGSAFIIQVPDVSFPSWHGLLSGSGGTRQAVSGRLNQLPIF